MLKLTKTDSKVKAKGSYVKDSRDSHVTGSATALKADETIKKLFV